MTDTRLVSVERGFIETVAETSNDAHLAHEAQRILIRLDDPERLPAAPAEAGLLRYGRHEETCPELHNDPPWDSCDCGFTAALAAAQEGAGE